MKQVDLIKDKILKQSEHISFLEILIALKCYLTNNEENAWYIFQNNDQDQTYLLSNQNLNYLSYKQKNDSLLLLVYLKPIDIILLAKNKKINLLEFVDDLILSYTSNETVIIDYLRTNPFQEDYLFKYITEKQFHKTIFDIYLTRNIDKQRIINLSKKKSKYYRSCAEKSKELKISDYWKNIWGLGLSYNLEKSIVDNIIL